jgi:pantoate--beta-alanine ligase
MKIIYQRLKLSEEIDHFKLKNPSKKIGFVPTMGALHSGHISLVNECSADNDLTIVSIFVNPTQFNDQNDYNKYPNTLEKDIELLKNTSCDILFAPDINEMYPKGDLQIKTWDFGFIGTVLDGAMRPGHFDGVAHIVSMLLQIVNPSQMYMGLKDYQQVLIVKEMANQIKSPVKIIGCPTYREQDGLAMSSRNIRLNEEDRILALNLSKALFYIKEHKNQLNPKESIENAITTYLSVPKIKLEYLEIRNAETLEFVDLTAWNSKFRYVVLIAAFVGDVRLVDNLTI